jgi:hypothetical protein
MPFTVSHIAGFTFAPSVRKFSLSRVINCV